MKRTDETWIVLIHSVPVEIQILAWEALHSCHTIDQLVIPSASDCGLHRMVESQEPGNIAAAATRRRVTELLREITDVKRDAYDKMRGKWGQVRREVKSLCEYQNGCEPIIPEAPTLPIRRQIKQHLTRKWGS